MLSVNFHLQLSILEQMEKELAGRGIDPSKLPNDIIAEIIKVKVES